MSETILKRYIRNGSHPVGCVVAVKHEDPVSGAIVVDLGYSICNPCDHFNKKLGTEIAIGRALSGFDLDAVPDDRYDDVVGELHQMAARASLYYKRPLVFTQAEVSEEDVDFLVEVEQV